MFFLLYKKREIIFWGLVIILLAVFGCLNAYAGSAEVFLNGRAARKLPIYSVETEEKKVALTFDASWGADKTDELISILKENDAKATFFLVGFWVEKYEDKVKKLQENGIEIGTHSNTHPDMTTLNQTKMQLELETSMNILEKVTGLKPKYFRPPYGAYNDKLITCAQDLGLMTIQWDVDSLDWKNLTVENITQRVISKTRNGSIILMHNNGENTAAALRLIILGLKNKGFDFVCVGELVYKDNFHIDHTGRQIKII